MNDYLNEIDNAENEMHQLPVGTLLIDRYEVGKTIGQGGFGITYAGKDVFLDMPVAIKEYFPVGVANRFNSYSLDVSASGSYNIEELAQGRSRFLKEARALARFAGDPNVVYVRDCFEANNTAYIVMEYLDGQSLRSYINDNGPCSFNEAYKLLAPVMDSVEKIHQNGLVHRDISPSNMMLLSDGRVKILDFGTTRPMSDEGEKSLSIVLKPGFAPEEQYRSRGGQGSWTDVYAMCATIYFMITGQVPENAMNRLFEDNLKAPSALGADINPAQDTVLMTGLAVDHKDRIQTIKQLKEEFEAASAHQEDAVSDKNDINPNSTVINYKKRTTSDETVRVRYSPLKSDSASEIKDNSIKREKPSKKIFAGKKLKIIIIAVAACIVIAAGLVLFFTSRNTRTSSDFQNKTIDSSDISSIRWNTMRDTTRDVVTFKNCVISDEMMKKLGAIKNIEQIYFYDNCRGFTTLEPLVNPTVIVIADHEYQGTQVNCDDLFSSSLGNITILRLLNVDITSGLGFLAQLPYLHELEISNCNMLKEPSSIPYMPALASFKAENTDLSFVDMSEVKNWNSLYQFKAQNCGLKDIIFLEGNNSLQYIDVSKNMLSDLKGIEGLTKLYELDAGNNEISDISALSACSSLKYLYLNHNNLTDISALNDCTSIKTLLVGYNQLTSLAACEKMIDLKILNAVYNQLTDTKGLENVTQLTNLYLSCNHITDITEVAKSKNKLQALLLDGNQLTDIDAITDSYALTVLTLDNNQLENLNALNACANLKYLSASGNRINDISSIAICSGLTYIDLGENQISDISALAEVGDEDMVLLLQNNNISDIGSLNTAPEYELLSIYNNPISDLSILESMINGGESMFVSYDNDWDPDYIAESDFSGKLVFLVDVPLDQRAEIKNKFDEVKPFNYPNFISSEEADINIASIRYQQRAAVGLVDIIEVIPETAD